MSRPEATRTGAEDDADPEMTAWIQQLSSDEPLPDPQAESEPPKAAEPAERPDPVPSRTGRLRRGFLRRGAKSKAPTGSTPAAPADDAPPTADARTLPDTAESTPRAEPRDDATTPAGRGGPADGGDTHASAGGAGAGPADGSGASSDGGAGSRPDGSGAPATPGTAVDASPAGHDGPQPQVDGTQLDATGRGNADAPTTPVRHAAPAGPDPSPAGVRRGATPGADTELAEAVADSPALAGERTSDASERDGDAMPRFPIDAAPEPHRGAGEEPLRYRAEVDSAEPDTSGAAPEPARYAETAADAGRGALGADAATRNTDRDQAARDTDEKPARDAPGAGTGPAGPGGLDAEPPRRGPGTTEARHSARDARHGATARPTRGGAIDADPAQPHQTHADPARHHQADAESAQPHQVDAEPARHRQANAESAQPRQTHADPARHLQASAESTQPHQVDAETARHHQADAESAQPHQVDAEPARHHRIDAESARYRQVDGNPRHGVPESTRSGDGRADGAGRPRHASADAVGDPATRAGDATAPGGSRGAVRPDVPTGELPARLRALAEFVAASEDRVPADRLAPVRALLARADERLALSGRHTVVVLAGTTGSGKSRLFNALTGLDLSRVGARRPTTADLHACIWDPDGTGPLLDWLGVPAENRTERESVLDGDAQRALHGLVLIDMPDFDSVEHGHRPMVDRLIGAADMVLWVLDPQKYADRTVHERYLSSLADRDAALTVVLNQVDRLPENDVDRLAADLRRLLAEDGLPAAPVHLASARTGLGVAALRSALADTVAGRQAAAVRLTADLTATADGLADLVAAEPPGGVAADRLADSLAEHVGVAGLVDAAEQDMRRRGRRATGWLFVRRALGGRNPDRILDQERYDLDWLDDTPRGEPDAGAHEPARPVPERESPRRVGLGGVLRGGLGPVADRLPAPWRDSLRRALTEQVPALAGRLVTLPAQAARGTRPAWWAVLGVLQWVFGVAAVAGAGWLIAASVSRAVPDPGLAALWLLIGGVVLGVGSSLVALPLVRRAARAERAELDTALRSEVEAAARDHVQVPVDAELAAYRTARDALDTARRSG